MGTIKLRIGSRKRSKIGHFKHLLIVSFDWIKFVVISVIHVFDMITHNVISKLLVFVVRHRWDVAWSWNMIVRWKHFCKCILHSQSSIKCSRLIGSRLEVTTLYRMFKWRWLQVVSSVIHGIPFPVLWNDRTILASRTTTDSDSLSLPQLIILLWCKLLPIINWRSAISRHLTLCSSFLYLIGRPVHLGIGLTLNSLDLLLNMILF